MISFCRTLLVIPFSAPVISGFVHCLIDSFPDLLIEKIFQWVNEPMGQWINLLMSPCMARSAIQDLLVFHAVARIALLNACGQP